MRHIQLIFRKVVKGDKWYQWGIGIWTKILPPNWFSKIKWFLCHTEIRFIERDECFSAANKGNFIGDRFDRTANVIKDPSKWVGFTILLSIYEEEKLYQACKKREGRKYDWWGVFLGFISPFAIQDKKRDYCSEVCNDVMFEAVLYPINYNVISPLRWAAKSSEYFHKELKNLQGT